MDELRKFVAPEIVFGVGAIDLASQYARNFSGKKILVVSDPGVIKAGWAKRVTNGLEAKDLDYVVFSHISPNPRAQEVMLGVEIYEAEKCDIIIAIGGGSTMDCAKGIGISSHNKCHILALEGVDKITIPGPPLICIPTTAGSSSDVSQFTIINNTEERTKITIVSKMAVPDVSLIDPQTSLTMDPYLTVCTAIDALSHAIEAYLSTANSPLTDLHALQAIPLIKDNLLKVLAEPNNLTYRTNMVLASIEAGLAFSNASLGAIHAMSHSAGGYLDLAHGECNAILLEHVISYNYPDAQDRYRDIGMALGLDMNQWRNRNAGKAILTAIGSLKKEAGMTHTLGNRGATKSDIPHLAKFAMRDPCLITNPRLTNQRDIELIYEESL